MCPSSTFLLSSQVALYSLCADVLARCPELRNPLLVLKFFLAQNRWNEPYWGGLGSYALTLLLVFLLQVYACASMSCEKREAVRLCLCWSMS